jgi:hypothetical protein
MPFSSARETVRYLNISAIETTMITYITRLPDLVRSFCTMLYGSLPALNETRRQSRTAVPSWETHLPRSVHETRVLCSFAVSRIMNSGYIQGEEGYPRPGTWLPVGSCVQSLELPGMAFRQRRSMPVTTSQSKTVRQRSAQSWYPVLAVNKSSFKRHLQRSRKIVVDSMILHHVCSSRKLLRVYTK